MANLERRRDPVPALIPGHFCYYVPECQDVDEHGGYVPSLVSEFESGHYPMLGNGACSSPWVWGKTLDEARAVAREQNAKLGVDDELATVIVARSMGIKLAKGRRGARR